MHGSIGLAYLAFCHKSGAYNVYEIEHNGIVAVSPMHLGAKLKAKVRRIPILWPKPSGVSLSSCASVGQVMNSEVCFLSSQK